MLVIPFLFLLFFSVYQFLKTGKITFQILIFLSLGFIFEAELPFGLFLIPSFFLTIFFSGFFKKFFEDKKSSLLSIIALFIPFSLRILFEIKHNFIQTKTALGFLSSGKIYNPHSFFDNFKDRLNLFWSYYQSLFTDKKVAIFVLIVLGIAIFYGYKKLEKTKRDFFRFNLILLLLLFLTSLLYRDNFWANYFEGLSYFYLILMITSFFSLEKVKKIFGNKKLTSLILIIILALNLIINFYKNISQKKSKELSGFVSQNQVVDYLYAQNKNRDFCVRIYTPPVIPYTYQYLFSYYSRVKKINKPSQDYVKGQCWYVIESDPYQFRIKKWRKEQIPDSAKIIKVKNFSKDLKVELWEEKKS